MGKRRRIKDDWVGGQMGKRGWRYRDCFDLGFS